MELVEYTQERELLEEFTHVAFMQQRLNNFKARFFNNSNHYIKHLALWIEPNLPPTKFQFVQSPKYITYQNIIKNYVFKYIIDQKRKEIISISDPEKITKLTPAEKLIRKRFSDCVSGIMRKLKKYVYEDTKSYKKCVICSEKIIRLKVSCVQCSTFYHYKCLALQGLKCTRCGQDFAEECLIHSQIQG